MSGHCSPVLSDSFPAGSSSLDCLSAVRWWSLDGALGSGIDGQPRYRPMRHALVTTLANSAQFWSRPANGGERPCRRLPQTSRRLRRSAPSRRLASGDEAARRERRAAPAASRSAPFRSCGTQGPDNSAGDAVKMAGGLRRTLARAALLCWPAHRLASGGRRYATRSSGLLQQPARPLARAGLGHVA